MAFMWNAKCFVSGYCHKSTVTWTLNMGTEALSRTAFQLDCVFFWNKALNTSLRHTRDPFMTNKILGKTFDVVGYSTHNFTKSETCDRIVCRWVDFLLMQWKWESIVSPMTDTKAFMLQHCTDTCLCSVAIYQINVLNHQVYREIFQLKKYPLNILQNSKCFV